ncbi:hypothetical protein [Fuscibacter oryzae]|uniref:HEPN domain-containing protein n=1 Tax=Fuscibacter oryzae TaxID=2803939 RepID=A0A8J7MU40_9RHOB|nr:hypothetical protein [Fuscibacter oryzae]MBL4927454.1 hypothetical protein [Fuscibacter oryzae]
MFFVNQENRANYYKYLARMNYEAALAADDVIGQWPGYNISAPPPVMVLCAQCVELSLKSYLLDKCVPEIVVRKLGHKLQEAWSACMDAGASPETLDVEILKIIEDLLVSGRLRYGDKSELGRTPVFGPLQELCQACLKLCGAPEASDIIG